MSSTTSDSCPPSADSPLDCVPPARGVVGRRSPGGILEAFRRRSKSDSKSSSSLDIAGGHSRPSSSTGRASHRGLMSTIKSHMPWSDKRSSSIDSSSITSSTQQQHNASSSHSAAREHGFHALTSHLSPVTHLSNDPYFTYTYGQDPRYSRRSGSVTRTVMDIFKRSDSLHNNNKRVGVAGLDCSPDEQHLVFVKFFKHYRCYDLIPVSAKLIVLDTQLIVKKAFHALVSNGVRAAPLWDASAHGYTGMLTITDFINILRTYYKTPSLKMEEIEEQKLEKWRKVLQPGHQRPFCTIDPYASLFDAIKTLIQEKVHRLPVVDPETGNVLYILTHKRLLKFLFLYYNDLPLPRHLDQPIRDLQLGTYENIATATMNTPLIDALHAFNERRVSALPVVDEKGKVIDVYAKFDVINLAAEKTYNNLDITIKKALEYRNAFFEGVVKCTPDETLSQVVEKVVKAEVHRIVVVDQDDLVIGMISLSDILSYLVLRPVGMEKKAEVVSATTIQQHTLLEESEDGVTDDEYNNAEDSETSVFRSSSVIPEVTVTEACLRSQELLSSSPPQRKGCIERQQETEQEQGDEEAEPDEKPVQCSDASKSRRILTSAVDIVG